MSANIKVVERNYPADEAVSAAMASTTGIDETPRTEQLLLPIVRANDSEHILNSCAFASSSDYDQFDVLGEHDEAQQQEHHHRHGNYCAEEYSQ